ncbi:MAG: phosphate/phosphite/phosphonate ABC transporter substrate-binding protein [Leptolyngbya sp. BL-A-14]
MTLGKKLYFVAGAGALILSGFILNSLSKMAQADSQPPIANTLTTFVQTTLAQRPQATLKIAFPSRADSTDLQRKANDVARFLSQELKMPVEAIVSDDTAAVEALRANRVDVAFLSSRPALKAEQLANARVYLAEVRPNYSGRYTYSSVMVVRNDSPLSRKATTKQTLEQLRGKKIAFTSPTSGSGFIFPVGELVKQGLVPNRDRLNGFFQQVTYGGNYSGALQAVLRGQADVAAVSEYALKPPYITAAEGKQLRRLYAISGVPAHSVAIDDDVPARQRTQIVNALLKLNQPQNNALLKNLYNSTELVQVEHSRHLQPMREALQRAGFAP